MWIFLFVLAIVPLVYYWSDSVGTMFPQMKSYLPEKQAEQVIESAPAARVAITGYVEESGRWYSSAGDKGQVYWAISADSAYRLAVGCHLNSPAALQVTHISGKALPEGLFLNYEYGSLELGAGAFDGEELVGAVAQLKTAYLQTRKAQVLAQFDLPPAESGAIARALQHECAPPAAE